MLSFGGILVSVGIAIILHTTYAAIAYREILKLQQEDFETLPSSLLLELAVGTALSTAGAYFLSGSLRLISASKQSRGSDIGGLRMDFVSFNSRSRAMPMNIPPIK
ncbi:hypothetical protein CEUSTIGMA_g7140.t1 [Chlamydomonas eustigma]|uniref:Uncharacterized protein n=1 Tax=Chlamydomonas eustigma TaxID=1157962 RepID=A0A250X9X8_9CHLO|nr:hypothetical protein CEUSTIGMA_g7140.t1 [Chlamydomonas eustigma]|eukprot:GAX79699.1 hypothetical protein CEUSTIGMA_g7140.t1 [Chlamydomonas eustigma]